MNKVIILAAGEGTRMKSKISKVLHKLCNKSILSYIIDASKEARAEEVIVIVGKNQKEVEKEFGNKIITVKQEIGENIPYGTGYAIKLVEKHIGDDDNILVLVGDVPLIRGETISRLMEYHDKKKNDATVLSAKFENPFGYGRIITDQSGNLIKIVEHKDCNEEELLVDEINSGIFIFKGDKLKFALNKLDTNNSQGEMYLTDVMEILKKENSNISSYIIEDNNEINGINTKIQLAKVEKLMRKRINESYMASGVIMENPETITIQKGVKIGMDTYIESNVKILGETEIGENCFIGMNSKIIDSKIGNDVKIEASYIEGAIMEDGSDIGPFSRLRKNSHLNKNVHIGNFVEVKNSTIGENTKAGHLAYIGDADLGKRINVSCGVIFANYDGQNKFRATIGDDSFLGSNVNIVSPIKISNKSFLAAGSTITKDVKEGSLAIERADEKVIEGYYDRKFNK